MKSIDKQDIKVIIWLIIGFIVFIILGLIPWFIGISEYFDFIF